MLDYLNDHSALPEGIDIDALVDQALEPAKETLLDVSLTNE